MTQQNAIETELRAAIENAQKVLNTITVLIETGYDIPADAIEALVNVAQKHLYSVDTALPF